MDHEQVKNKITLQYIVRVKGVSKAELVAGNNIMAVNSFVISIMTSF